MRTYLILRKGKRWNADAEIQSLLAERQAGGGVPKVGTYSKAGVKALLAHSFDREYCRKRSAIRTSRPDDYGDLLGVR